MSKPLSSVVFENLTPDELVAHALNNKEGVLAKNQALRVETGKRTGRSPLDRFIVQDDVSRDTVEWGRVNQPISADNFNELWGKTAAYLANKPLYVSHLRVGSDAQHFLPVEVVTETAWHNLFVQHMFVKPEGDYKASQAGWQLLSAPSFHTDPDVDSVHSDGAVLINLTDRKVLICGIAYAGEMKKAFFSILNYFCPDWDILPMHCAANADENGENTALFFGLSGTGKTTLSADPERYLIGDDEHAWSSTGIFNFEGGCYAKCINLTQENEPVIWRAISAGAIMENVVLDSKTGEPDYSDVSLTQNTRAAYPRTHIEQRILSNMGPPPKAVIFLTCDLYGVLPPISLLSKTQAAYHFLSGYTALVGSTELGAADGVSVTFSRCFGAPFFPRPAAVYADLLIKRLTETGAQVYLVNTGWTGGAYAEGGERFSIPTTRAVVRAALRGDLLGATTQVLGGFDLLIPTDVAGVDSVLLNPRNTWADVAAYDEKRNLLAQQFLENFKQYDVSQEIRAAAPHVL